MGSVTFVFAGDFWQTLPVITKETRADVIRACLKSSYLWSSVETINLRTNMRAYLSDNNDNDFPHQLLNLGEGKNSYPNTNITSDDIKFDYRLGHILHRLEHMIGLLIYPDLEKLLERDYHWLCSRVIVSHRNDTVNEINKLILEKIGIQIKHYKSIDTVCNIEGTVHYPQKILNSLSTSGLPPNDFILKVGIPIMLLRNLSPPICVMTQGC